MLIWHLIFNTEDYNDLGVKLASCNLLEIILIRFRQLSLITAINSNYCTVIGPTISDTAYIDGINLLWWNLR